MDKTDFGHTGSTNSPIDDEIIRAAHKLVMSNAKRDSLKEADNHYMIFENKVSIQAFPLKRGIKIDEVYYQFDSETAYMRKEIVKKAQDCYLMQRDRETEIESQAEFEKKQALIETMSRLAE